MKLRILYKHEESRADKFSPEQTADYYIDAPLDDKCHNEMSPTFSRRCFAAPR